MNCKKDITEFVSHAFGITHPRVAPLGGKTESSALWKVEAEEGMFVLKGSSWYAGFTENPARTLECVYAVAAHLALRGVPLQVARRTLQGGFMLEWNGLPTVLLEYREGLPFDGSEAQFVSAGAALAGFHKAGAELLKSEKGLRERIRTEVPVEKPYEESRELYLRAGFREKLLALHACAEKATCDAVRMSVPLLDKTIAFIDVSLEKAGALTESVLHNDLSYANGLYRADGSWSAFLDVDQLGVGPCLFDIGNTLASFATEFLKKGTQKELERRVNAFLAAYRAEFPLPEQEYVLVLAATERWDVMRILRTLRRHHFENNRLPDLMPKISKRFLPRIASAPEWFGFLTKKNGSDASVGAVLRVRGASPER